MGENTSEGRKEMLLQHKEIGTNEMLEIIMSECKKSNERTAEIFIEIILDCYRIVQKTEDHMEYANYKGAVTRMFSYFQKEEIANNLSEEYRGKLVAFIKTLVRYPMSESWQDMMDIDYWLTMDAIDLWVTIAKGEEEKEMAEANRDYWKRTYFPEEYAEEKGVEIIDGIEVEKGDSEAEHRVRNADNYIPSALEKAVNGIKEDVTNKTARIFLKAIPIIAEKGREYPIEEERIKHKGVLLEMLKFFDNVEVHSTLKEKDRQMLVKVLEDILGRYTVEMPNELEIEEMGFPEFIGRGLAEYFPPEALEMLDGTESIKIIYEKIGTKLGDIDIEIGRCARDVLLFIGTERALKKLQEYYEREEGKSLLSEKEGFNSVDLMLRIKRNLERMESGELPKSRWENSGNANVGKGAKRRNPKRGNS